MNLVGWEGSHGPRNNDRSLSQETASLKAMKEFRVQRTMKLDTDTVRPCSSCSR